MQRSWRLTKNDKEAFCPADWDNSSAVTIVAGTIKQFGVTNNAIPRAAPTLICSVCGCSTCGTDVLVISDCQNGPPNFFDADCSKKWVIWRLHESGIGTVSEFLCHVVSMLLTSLFGFQTCSWHACQTVQQSSFLFHSKHWIWCTEIGRREIVQFLLPNLFF